MTFGQERKGLDGILLANPGDEHLVLQPGENTDPFTVTLEAGSYLAEWHSLNSREAQGAETVIVEREGSTSFTVPSAEAGPAVLCVKRAGG